MIPRIRTGLLTLLALLCILPTTLAQDGIRWITYQTSDGETVYLDDNRQPALYTGNFGDCAGGSAINVTRFDAAYYKDNMTVIFHLAGNSGIANDSLMLYIGVYAYGESRFDLVFNPCQANIYSLCPINASVPIEAEGIIPVGPSDVANIPPIALSIPDFEGEAVLRIFSNTSREQIACYSASVTNGHSFSQPASVGTVLGVFTAVALFASFATAIYGEAVPTMRLHYAHSLSVGVVFAVFQHIFFTGALSLNWPSVLVAWWSNFAWSGGMIYVTSMQHSIDMLIGNKIGSTSEVGAAQAGSATSADFGGGYQLTEIFGRSLKSTVSSTIDHPMLRDVASKIYQHDHELMLKRNILQRSIERVVAHRYLTRDVLANSSTGFSWYGHPVGPGLPLPGNYSGFAGTLSGEGIRVSNAFMTGLLWFLILFAILVSSVVAFKWILEGLARTKAIHKDRLRFFREHWVGYTTLVALRTCYIAFFTIIFLAVFQFTFSSSGAVKGIAALVFVIFLVGMAGAAAYAVQRQRLASGHTHRNGKPTEQKTLLGKIPWLGGRKVQPSPEEGSESRDGGKTPLFGKSKSTKDGLPTDDNAYNIHDDEDYTQKFGWLASRFRRTRWWFFTFWLTYEFVRALFYGGASGSSLAQVFGLLVVEILACGFVIWARPFEGQRLNIIVVYCLSFSKIFTLGLSIAFDVSFNVGRIATTAIGIVIIVIQGILTIVTMIAIIVGAGSSYMSISRNREDFRPRTWAPTRDRYFNHLDRVVDDLPPEPKPVKAKKERKSKALPQVDPVYGFEMKHVRRVAKIEDEDNDFASEMGLHTVNPSYLSLDGNNRLPTPGTAPSPTPMSRSRTNSKAASIMSTSQTNLPYGARPHRPSWSTKDFAEREAAGRSFTPVDMSRTVPDDDAITPIAAAGRRPSQPLSKESAISIPAAEKLRSPTSNDSLHVGGDLSTRDTIGKVPMPAMRPRAGTLTRPASRGSFPQTSEAGPSNDVLSPEPLDSRPGSQRASAVGSTFPRSQPLTPAQEVEEWIPRESDEKPEQ